MKQLNVKKLVLLNLPYILLGLFATNLGEAWRLAAGADASAKMLSFFSTLPVALGSWWPSLHPLDLAVGICCGAALRLAVYLKGKNAKKYRHNMEYGSARWGTHDDMDSSIFLGGKEPTTLKELAAVLGKETIDTYNTGESRGRETSHSLNYQKLGKELMSQDELAVMDGGKCILQLRGVRPFLSDKYDITQHPNYKYTADADPKNAFSIEDFLRARLKLKPNQVCDVYEIDAAADD